MVSIHPETLFSMTRRNTMVESDAIGQISETLTIGKRIESVRALVVESILVWADRPILAGTFGPATASSNDFSRAAAPTTTEVVTTGLRKTLARL